MKNCLQNNRIKNLLNSIYNTTFLDRKQAQKEQEYSLFFSYKQNTLQNFHKKKGRGTFPTPFQIFSQLN